MENYDDEMDDLYYDDNEYEPKFENVMSFDEFINEEKRPSSGLSKRERSAVVRKARKGGDIGKKGKHFDEIVKKSEKKYGKDSAKKIAAAAMWKNIKH